MCRYLETSSSDGTNVDDAFMYLIEKSLLGKDRLKPPEARATRRSVFAKPKEIPKKTKDAQKQTFRPSVPYWARSSAGQFELKEQIEISDRKWKSFEINAKLGDLIFFDDIPWPDKTNVLGVLPTQTKDEKKRRYREMTKRWHPDRFAGQFGSYLNPEEKAKILDEVHQVCKRINHEKPH